MGPHPRCPGYAQALPACRDITLRYKETRRQQQKQQSRAEQDGTVGNGHQPGPKEPRAEEREEDTAPK